MNQFIRIFSCFVLFGNSKRSLSCMNKNYKQRFVMVFPSMTAVISRFRTALSLTFLYLSTILFLICFISIPQSYSQEVESDSTELQESAVRIFLDRLSSYQDHIKREIPFVNYVRDRKQAQVYIMLTTQRTGAGGLEYTLTLTGQQNFVNQNDTLKYVSRQTDTQEIRRSGIVRILKMGLMPYVSKTPLAEYISINYRKRTDPGAVVDKWDYWVFNSSIRGFFNGEESIKSMSIYGSVSADRVAPDWKTSLSFSTNYNETNYKIGDNTISSFIRSHSFRGLLVKSLGGHWSIGVYGDALSSIYTNTKFSFNVAPAIEYNVFPYAQSTRREFRFLYRVGNTNIRYDEETIYEKLRENLVSESLSATYEVKERWGSVSTTLAGSHYSHDFSKNRLVLFSNLSLRLFEGFSLSLLGSASRIHDQLSLPKKGATEEEILLRQKQLATQYSYYFSIGLRYTFGSIYSNVVNPRFGN